MKKTFLVSVLALALLWPVVGQAADVHVLTADKNGNYRVVKHEAIPGGNNLAGVTWKSAYIEWKKTRNEDGTISSVDSMLTEGTGTGQITAAERAQVRSGDVMEIVFPIPARQAVSSARVTEEVSAKVTEYLANLAVTLKWYGYTQGD
jgi:hypothetical protein